MYHSNNIHHKHLEPNHKYMNLFNIYVDLNTSLTEFFNDCWLRIDLKLVNNEKYHDSLYEHLFF
jgi:hypothetical protein